MPIHLTSSDKFGLLAKRAADGAVTFALDGYSAIVLSALWLESYLNEVLHLAAIAQSYELEEPIVRLRLAAAAAALDSRDSRIEVKLQVLISALTGELLDRGAQPYQDFDLLVTLRNHLVHNRPETITEAFLPQEEGELVVAAAFHKQITRLVSRGIVPPVDPQVLWSLNNVLARPEVAAWAYDAALAVITRVVEAFPEGAWRRRVLFGQRQLDALAVRLGAA